MAIRDVNGDKKGPGPLAGVRVVDVCRYVAGAVATRILADLGAEVIKVESPQSFAPLRLSKPVPGGEPGSLNRSPLWANLNHNKMSVSLNLWHPTALEVLKRLISVSDIVVESMRPRVMARWGLTYKEVTKLRPDIVYVSISGFGHSGMHSDYVSFGPVAQALGGLTLMTGLPGYPPAGVGFSILDYYPGCFGALGALGAYYHRQQSGPGQHIDVSQVDVGAVVTGPSVLDRVVNQRSYRRPGNPPGNRSTSRPAAPEGVYPCKGQDQWCAITVRTDEEWQSLGKALGGPAWARDSKFLAADGRSSHREELDARLADHTRQFSKHELMELLQKNGVAAGAVQSPEDRARDPQLAAREYFRQFHYPGFGSRPTDVFPFKFSSYRVGELRPPPTIGQDNDYVLHHLLNMSGEETELLAKEGAI